MDRRNLLQTIALATGVGFTANADDTAPAQAALTTKPTKRKTPMYVTTADGTQLFCRSWGEGPPVLFVAAWALPSDAWQYQMIRLADEGYRCIAFDRRGHGRSEDPGHGYDMETLVDDLARIVDAFDLHDVTLIGHSLGCGEIVRYLTRHGAARVKRVALIAPITPYLPKAPDNLDGVDPKASEFARNAFRHDFPGILDANMRPFVVTETPQAVIAWIENMMTRTSLKAVVECNRAFGTADFRKDLPGIALPTLILQGTADVSAPLALTGQRTAKLMPNAKLTVYDGAPHGLIFTHVDRVNGDLLEFLRS